MAACRTSSTWTRADLLARAGWSLLAAIHVPVLLKSSAHLLAEPGWEQSAKWAVVVLSLAFFAAKVAGVRVLKVRCRASGAVVFLVACGLIHGPVREKASSDRAPEAAAVLVLAGTGALAAAVMRRGGRLAGSGSSAAGAALLGPVWAVIDDGRAAVARSLTGLALAVPRGPPGV
jgi:hypothetical protein